MPEKTAKKTITCLLLRDYWVEENDRRRKGETIELDVDTAFDMIEAGLVTRKK